MLVHARDSGDIVAVSREAGVVDEEMVIDLPGGRNKVRVRVMESRLLVVAGTVRHQMRLREVTRPEIVRRGGPKR